MPTNDERREVAARLRSVADKGAPEWATSACCIAECLGEGNYPLWNGSEKLFALLADLIEPEERTCRMEPNERGYPVCSNCGEEMSAYTCEWVEPMEYSYPFCYACGAKVVGE